MSNLTAIASGPSTLSPSDGSRTQIVHDSQPKADEDSNLSHDQGDTPHGVLRLRGGPKSKPAVVWSEDVIDNENMGKKSSKICCIYHKARKFAESSSEDSSSESDSDSDRDHTHHRHRHHQSANGNGGAEKKRNGEGAQVEELESDDEPNAYERPPGWKNKGKRKANAGSPVCLLPFTLPPKTFNDDAMRDIDSLDPYLLRRTITTYN